MTVKELIEKLSELSPDAIVIDEDMYPIQSLFNFNQHVMIGTKNTGQNNDS